MAAIPKVFSVAEDEVAEEEQEAEVASRDASHL
jgi:hypothetical protein